MDYVINTLSNLIHQTAFFNLTWGNYVMILVAFIFLFLAIRKGYEPLLLVPISFGILLVNIFPDIMLRVEAVSYTHLDVYKRQMQGCADQWEDFRRAVPGRTNLPGNGTI